MMDFNQLVEFYERIAATPKRLESSKFYPKHLVSAIMKNAYHIFAK